MLKNSRLPLQALLEQPFFFFCFTLCTKVETEEEKRVALEELVKEVVSFSTNLEFHSVREEDILFRMMEVYLGKNGGPIAVMEYEHEQANGFINTFLSKTENQSLTPEEIIENTNLIKDAYHTLLDHFMKEEQVLYPMAEKLFSEEEKELFKQKVTVVKGNTLISQSLIYHLKPQ